MGNRTVREDLLAMINRLLILWKQLGIVRKESEGMGTGYKAYYPVKFLPILIGGSVVLFWGPGLSFLMSALQVFLI